MAKLFTALIAALVLLCAIFVFSIKKEEPAHATEPAQTYYIYSASDFTDYARAYALGDRNPKDVLNVSISSGNEITDDTYISLGTAERPFAGTLVIPTVGIDTFRLSNCPLFSYVSTEMRVTGSGVIKIIREAASETPAEGVLTSGSLFADHVVKGSTAATWNVTLLPYTGEGTAASGYAGVMGEVESECDVTLRFTNTSDMSVVGSGTVGLICGTLKSGATLSVTTAGTGGSITVSSSGNVGGIVGKTEEDATLNLLTANNSRVGNVTTTSGYAGGIVGEAIYSTINVDGGVSDYAVTGQVTGETGAGGLFGHYKTKKTTETFSMQKYSTSSRMRISAQRYAGGIFGYLESESEELYFDGYSASKSFSFVLALGSERGGVCGRFSARALTDVFSIHDLTISVNGGIGNNFVSAGLIGAVSDDPAYIRINDVSITASSSTKAGLIAKLGSGGSFADVEDVTISGTFDAGMIGDMPEGVLRIKGSTDFSSYTQSSGGSALIVLNRDRSLVYATGNGEGTGWTLKRNLSNSIDDIHGWGEVLRADGTSLKESDLFDVNETAHTVTLKAAATSINNVTEFAKTALNIQLNTQAAVGALAFTSGSANESSALLSGTITLMDDVTLAGTGLTGFTRDDGQNDVFSGTLDGKGFGITLAIGEKYGLKSDGTALTADSNQGNIYRHMYNGLFAKIKNAVVKDLTLTGNITIYQTEDGMEAGGLAAQAEGTVSLTSVTTEQTLGYKVSGTDNSFIYGGCIGVARGNGVAVTATDCTFAPTVTDVTGASVGSGGTAYIGGFIGCVRTAGLNAPTQSVSLSDSVVALTYTRTENTNRPSVFGGVISQIESASYIQSRRTVTLSNIDLNVTATGIAASNKFGGLLGYEWLASDVTVSGVAITASITATGSATSFGGLTQTATGRWDLQSLSLASCSYTLPNNGSSFGFVANMTYKTGVALYLDVNDVSSAYDIGALTFTSDPNFVRYDEIVAESVGSSDDIMKNGNSIVSVTTDGNVIDTSGSAFNTYLNKTAYGRDKGKINDKTRYYYNVAYARANVATAKYKFLVWSIMIYAHSSLSSWFSASAPFTGSLDMTGLSYYPIDLTGSVSFTNATIKLDNALMETSVKYAYRYTDGELKESPTRSTRTNTDQHYLMHTAVFHNVTGTLNLSNVTTQGNVPRLDDAFCGFIVSGTIGDSDSAKANCSFASIILDGVYVSNGDARLTSDTYAPLAINKIGKNATFEWNGAEQSANYASFASNGYYAGSSLIGDVGSSSARTIYLTFGGLAFDTRVSATSIDNFDTVYHTTKTIFLRSSVLNSFVYFGESSGSYNFTIDEDRTSALSATHKVTYGKEITTSVEHAGNQKKYYGSEYFVSPTTYQASSEYDFSTGFLPYVYVPFDLGEYKHELSVNVTFNSIIEGCGKYGDPFIIDDDTKLPILSKIITGDDVGNTVQLNLPSDLTQYDYTDTAYTKYLYNFGLSTFISSNGGSDQTNANVRRYLAGAYYVITKDLTLPYDYVALGTSSETQYAFRGVIIGRGNPVVTNNSPKPLIYSSNGCVVKDITLEVDVDYNSSNVIELNAPRGSDVYAYSDGIQSYGAVIGQIMGGDTFIDNVQVEFTNVTFSITTSETYYERLTPIGGYVGVLVNGGLVFRNMSSANVGLTSAKESRISDSGYLYINPIIGRVIAGYAFNETSAYHATESECILKNGEKNYTISDLCLSEGKLNVGYSSSKFTVTVPNGQAMFVLGAIVNSGAASASYSASNVNPYQSLSDFWSAYREHTTTRAGASYLYVGESGFASSSDFVDYAKKDEYTETLAKTPYIIRAYSNMTGSVYLTRCISSKTNTIVVVSGNCDVAQGFRGIGSIYSNSDYVHLGISQMTGRIGETQTSYQITLHMRYLEYNHKSVSSYIAYAEANSEKSEAGFGLFTRLSMSSASDSNSIRYITLAGSVYYDVYTIDGEKAKYNFANYKGTKNDRPDVGEISSTDTEDVTLRRTILSVGGIAGYVRTRFFMIDVTFNNLYVEGAKTAGGMVGFVFRGNSSEISYIKYDSPSVVNNGFVNVVGGLQAGGLIGRIYRAAVEIIGADGGTNIVIRNVESKNSDPNESGMQYYANLNTGVGGVVGACWALDIDSTGEVAVGMTTRRLFIDNINVVKGTDTANVRVLNDSGTKNNHAGGFIGLAHNTYIKITNSKLEVVNVSANVAGGFIGKVSQKYLLYIDNCSADGNDKACAINGTRYAGGAVGWAIGRDQLYFQLLDYVTKGYVIESTTTGSVQAAAGGAVGYAQGDNKDINDSANHICEFNNLTVLNCDIKTNYTNKVDNYIKYKCGTGGLIGVIDTAKEGNENSRTSNNKYKFSGYNILIKDCTFTHKNGGISDDSTSATNRRIGDIVGNNAIESPLKFVGVAVQNESYCGKHVGYFNDDVNHYGSGGTYGSGYVVFANFNAATENTSFGNCEDGTTSADDYTEVPARSPYITVNPTITIGGLKITSDGVADSVNELPIQSILADTSGLYAYASNAYYSGSSGDTNKQAFSAYTGKLTMFASEVTGYLGTNFPILVVDDTTRANSHRMINSYLRLLTNTQHDFGEDVTGVYSVQIYRVTYSDGTFTPFSAATSLKRADGEFYMTNALFDSGKIQFSLIDVRFFDPADGETVAYHLYVPVFVKKVISYSFDIAVQSGTNYLASRYTSKFGDALIENVGTPVTLFFRYTYSRTLAEWESAINAGESVHRNYEKTLYFYKANTNDILKSFPSETILVLVDANRGGKPYYATIGTALSGSRLNLSAFREDMASDGTLGGDFFTPVNLEDMMTISVTTVGGGEDKLVACEVGSASVVVNGQGYRAATDEELEDGSVTKYSVTLSGSEFTERYYLSVFTESNAVNDLLFHYYLITTPTSFGEAEYPSKITDTGAHTMVHLVMGKIFYHGALTVESYSLLGTEIVTADNNVLTIDMKAELGLSDDLDEEIKTNLQSLIGATQVYQSFLVYLNRKEGNEVVKAIIGDPTIGGEYAVDYVLNGSADVETTAYGAGDIRLTQNYVEVVTGDLHSRFASGNKFEIISTVSLTYDNAGLVAQFPGRGTSSPDSGVTVSASSNVAFSQTGTTYSKNVVRKDETPEKSYYSEADPAVAVLDLNAIGDKVGDFTPLGINALNNGGSNYGNFDLLAVLDISSVSELIPTYTAANITVKLMRKGNDGMYGNLLDISDYLTVSFEGSPAATDEGTSYAVSIPSNNANIVDNGASVTLPVLHFSVKTGAVLEEAEHFYSNYRVLVEVSLINENGGVIAASCAANYVIYTNAKVSPSFVD